MVALVVPTLLLVLAAAAAEVEAAEAAGVAEVVVVVVVVNPPSRCRPRHRRSLSCCCFAATSRVATRAEYSCRPTCPREPDAAGPLARALSRCSWPTWLQATVVVVVVAGQIVALEIEA